MSGKIKGKDLSYDSTLPPFLQRLHARNAGSRDVDRHEFQVARPKRAKEADDEDDPVIVDESGETVSKDQFARLAETKVGNAEGVNDDNATSHATSLDKFGIEAAQAQRSDSKVTDGAAQRKRKVAKVIGDDDDDAKAPSDSASIQAKAQSNPKKKKKAKVKLAFEDEDAT